MAELTSDEKELYLMGKFRLAEDTNESRRRSKEDKQRDRTKYKYVVGNKEVCKAELSF
jgi:hypothetical protein